MDAPNTKIMNTAREASEFLTKDIEHANRIAQASKDLAGKWSALAEQEHKRVEDEEKRRRLREDLVIRIEKMDKSALDKLKNAVSEVR